MIELETAVFLQNHKTGSTFVEHFLKANSDEKIITYPAHKAPGVLRKGKFHFTTVREPLDLYLSLFNYGLDGGGYVWHALGKRGLSHYYDNGFEGFEPWLKFLLSDEFGPVFRKFAPYSTEMGLCTWRFFRLAKLNFNRKKVMIDSVLRIESLNAELKALTHGPLSKTVRNVDEACDWIDGRSQINPSTRRDQDHDVLLSHDTIALLRAKEAYLYETYYPQHAKRLTFRAHKLMRWRKVELSDLR